MTAQTRPVTVELWVRSLSPRGAGKARSAAIRRLEQLQQADRIDGFRVRVWSERIGRSTPEARTERGRTILERVAAFQEWADSRGLSLEPFFEERSREGAMGRADAIERVQVLPEVALAEFRAGDLRWLTPCSDGNRHYAVEEHLAALQERGQSSGRPTRVPLETE